MKVRLLTVAALLTSTTSAYAVGLDRSGQRIAPLFAEGNHLEFSFSYTDPTLEGTTGGAFTGSPLDGAPIANVADGYLIWSAAVKYDVNDQLSLAFIIDEPYGSDTLYTENPAFSVLGGTGATVDSIAYTALARYEFNENWSVHGGLRYQEVSATVSLNGQAFAASGSDGFTAQFGNDGDVGYVVGAAYEIPEIALRVALTYNSSTTHDFPTAEFGGPIPTGLVLTSTTEVDTPEALNLDFQTGIAPDTLLFGNVRYAWYSQTEVIPQNFGRSLTDLEDGLDFSIGVGRRFNEKWSGSVSVGLTTRGDDDLVSPLAPFDGSRFIAVGGKYDVNETFAIAGGIRYTHLGSARAAPGGSRPVADFEDGYAISAGLRFEYKF